MMLKVQDYIETAQNPSKKQKKTAEVTKILPEKAKVKKITLSPLPTGNVKYVQARPDLEKCGDIVGGNFENCGNFWILDFCFAYCGIKPYKL